MTDAQAPGRLRILIVDDSPEDRATYRRMLSHGMPVRYEFSEAEAAEDGLRHVRQQRPDCILLDFRLPDLNGLEFLSDMARFTGVGDVAVVMLTGQGDEQVAAEAIKSGAQEYLSKGRLEADALHTSIQSAVRLSRTQKELEIQRQQLERSNRDLERYARVVAHDLQAPLKGISAGLAGLRERSGERLDPKSAEFVAEAIENAGRMADLIRDILDYSRARADTTPFEPVDMAKVAALAVANLREQIESSGAAVKIQALPTIQGNESQLLQLLQNLISNAIKYRSAEPPQIEVWADRIGENWRFTVRDNGMGMDPRQVGRIFEPFIRLHPANEIEGTGVGLAICRAVVERHGGTIWVETEPGKGSAFSFSIPAQAAQGPAHTEAAA
jgi:light-regulated signal transduction histidine kinase (bacteriophytochrome)